MTIDFARLYAQKSLLLAKAANVDELEGVPDFLEADRMGASLYQSTAAASAEAPIKSHCDVDARGIPKRRCGSPLPLSSRVLTILRLHRVNHRRRSRRELPTRAQRQSPHRVAARPSGRWRTEARPPYRSNIPYGCPGNSPWR